MDEAKGRGRRGGVLTPKKPVPPFSGSTDGSPDPEVEAGLSGSCCADGADAGGGAGGLCPPGGERAGAEVLNDRMAPRGKTGRAAVWRTAWARVSAACFMLVCCAVLCRDEEQTTGDRGRVYSVAGSERTYSRTVLAEPPAAIAAPPSPSAHLTPSLAYTRPLLQLYKGHRSRTKGTAPHTKP